MKEDITMKKTYKLQDLDCANCAAKMERAIQKLPGVNNAAVSFMTQRMSLECEDGTDWDALLKEVLRVIQKVEPGCKVVVR